MGKRMDRGHPDPGPKKKPSSRGETKRGHTHASREASSRTKGRRSGLTSPGGGRGGEANVPYKQIWTVDKI